MPMTNSPAAICQVLISVIRLQHAVKCILVAAENLDSYMNKWQLITSGALKGKAAVPTLLVLVTSSRKVRRACCLCRWMQAIHQSCTTDQFIRCEASISYA
jgi:hypothetical protein